MSRSVSRSATLLAAARARAGLSQRALAKRARTAQSVVSRIENGEASPTWSTLERLLAAAGLDLLAEVQPRPVLDAQELDDVARILRMTPEERLREVANVSHFLAGARRG